MNTELGIASAIILFIIGTYGLTTKKDGLKLIISLEILIMAANLAFITIGILSNAEAISQTYVILLLSLGAPLIGFGIVLIILIDRKMAHIDVSRLNSLRW